MKKRIIFFIDSPGYGGSEINAIKLLEFLKEYYIIELVLNNKHCKQIVDFVNVNQISVHYFSVGNNQLNVFKGFILAKRLINKFKNDIIIIWSHHIDSNRWIQLCLAFFKKKFIVVEQLIPNDYNELKKSKLAIPIKKFVCSRSFTNVICAYSQYDIYHQFFSTKNITIIPNTRNILKIRSEVNDFKKTFTPNISLNNIRICCIGRLTEQKDPFTIIKAVSLLKNKFDISLIFIGNGELMNDVKSLSFELGLSNVLFIGHDENPLKWLAYCDLFILTSLYEGLPGALIEAMAAGVPCIATDIPGNRELIINNETGLSVSIKDYNSLARAIDIMLNDKEFNIHMATNAYQHVLQNYDVTREREMWLNLLIRFEG
jgi:glycosyltransferase involved in cell wall biosynthesis